MATRCKACGTRTTASAGYCQGCKSKRHHGYKRLKEEKLLLDEAGGAWWIWNPRGDVVVTGKPTREAAIIALGGGDVEDDMEDDVPTADAHATKKKTAAQLDLEIDEELAKARAVWSRSKPVEKTDAELKKAGLCTYCGKPTRKGSALIDGWPAHKSCVAEYES